MILPEDSEMLIGGTSFVATAWLNNFLKARGAFIRKDTLIRARNADGFRIPDYIHHVSDSCFRNNGKTSIIEIATPLEYIPDSCFRGCRNLVQINIPDSVKSIGFYAFYNCKYLQDIHIPDGVPILENGIFYKCESLDFSKIHIPESVKVIGQLAFAETKTRGNIRIPENVKFICADAFYGCEFLNSIEIPKDCVITDCDDSYDFMSFGLTSREERHNLTVNRSEKTFYIGKYSPEIIPTRY